MKKDRFHVSPCSLHKIVINQSFVILVEHPNSSVFGIIIIIIIIIIIPRFGIDIEI